MYARVCMCTCNAAGSAVLKLRVYLRKYVCACMYACVNVCMFMCACVCACTCSAASAPRWSNVCLFVYVAMYSSRHKSNVFVSFHIGLFLFV